MIKKQQRNTVILLWIFIITVMLSGCISFEQQKYRTFLTCEENPSDDVLKPEVAAELNQYAEQFSAYLTNAVETACAGDYSALKQLRSETVNPMVSFSNDGIKIETIFIESDTGSPALRIYSPLKCSVIEKMPVVTYMHGGAWAFGSASGTDHIAAGICRESSAVVVSVDYRLAPEYPFPAGFEDCSKAVEWVRHNACRYNGDPDLIYLAGDSAGGNLAASVAISESTAGRSIKGVILFYPAVDLTGSVSGSMNRFASGYGLDLDFFRKVIRCYIPDPDMRTEYKASPARADVQNMPPVLIMSAQFDILRDDARKFAEKLSSADKYVRYICLQGVTHAFLDSSCCTVEFNLTMKETAGFIFRTSKMIL